VLNSTIRISNYRFYVKEFLLIFFGYLFTEGIFSWLFVPNSIIIQAYEKLLVIGVYGFVLLKFNHLKSVEKLYVVLFSAVMLRLVVESLYKYNTFFQQLTMFIVLAPVMFVIFIKAACRSLEFDLLEFIAKFYIFTYTVFMLVYGRGFSFSLAMVDMNDYGPFSGDSRVIHARSIFMMIIPLLWYLNQYILYRKSKYLFPFLYCFIVIVIHQHRSVWSSAIVALSIYLWASIRSKRIKLPAIANVAVSGVVATLVAVFFISNMVPGFLDFLGSRFSEILNPAKEGSTGNFRIEQRETYFELFKQRPIFGWTFEGFEMPNPLVDWWPEKTGQHFHEGYMEMLFYEGIVGLLLKYSFLFYFLYKIFSKKLSTESIIIMAVCICGLVFSFNYVLPLVFWAHVGLGLYYIERDSASSKPSGTAITQPYLS
jgi:hypothetical protein